MQSKPEVYFIKYKTQKEHIHAEPAVVPVSLPAPEPLPIAETPIVVANDSYELPVETPAPRQPSPVYGPSAWTRQICD